MPAVRSVSMGIYIQVGSRYEAKSIAGISHFIEHMVFKGCAEWPTALDIASEIEGRGGYINASTGQEFTSFWVKIGARFWRQALSLLASMIQRPIFDPGELERERGVILDEIHMYRDMPEDYVSVLSNEALWGDNALGREIAGEPETVAQMGIDAIKRYHSATYAPDRTIISIAGAIDVDTVLQVVDSQFGAWSPVETSPVLQPAPPPHQHQRLRVHNRECEQAHLQMAVRGIPRHHPDRFALGLLNAVLGEGMMSRLWQRLREQQGLAYQIGSYVSTYKDSGGMGVYGGCDATRLFETLNETMLVWQELQHADIEESELKHFQEYARGRLELSSEDSSAVAGWWGRQYATGADPETLDDVLAAIANVKVEDLRRLALSLWDPQKLTLAYVGSSHSEDELLRWLQQQA